MKTKSILNIIKSKSIVIPIYMLNYYKKLNLNELELIFLCYLATFGEHIPFDLELFSKETNLGIENLMQLITSLEEKKLIAISIIKNSKGITEEYITIDNFNNKILGLSLEKEETSKSDIYTIIEKEFGRTLSPIEYETIKKWLDSGLKEDMIFEALKESILNGVFSLKYIDKILQEWSKKGRNLKKQKKEDEEPIELFDYNWLDDHE